MVLLSGGLDSATALAWARAQGFECYALSVAYGQRHQAELDGGGARCSRRWGRTSIASCTWIWPGIGGSALTDWSIALPEQPSAGIPISYVPARNTLLLALALGWAEVLAARDLVIGVNAVDYSAAIPIAGREFIRSFRGAGSARHQSGRRGRALSRCMRR